jgi:hypothetical protein
MRSRRALRSREGFLLGALTRSALSIRIGAIIATSVVASTVASIEAAPRASSTEQRGYKRW